MTQVENGRASGISIMSCDVLVKVKIRAVDARRFVREFKKEYGNRIEDARKLKTEGDVLDAVFTADRIRLGHL